MQREQKSNSYIVGASSDHGLPLLPRHFPTRFLCFAEHHREPAAGTTAIRVIRNLHLPLRGAGNQHGGIGLLRIFGILRQQNLVVPFLLHTGLPLVWRTFREDAGGIYAYSCGAVAFRELRGCG